jgi:hypothetical protein
MELDNLEISEPSESLFDGNFILYTGIIFLAITTIVFKYIQLDDSLVDIFGGHFKNIMENMSGVYSDLWLKMNMNGEAVNVDYTDTEIKSFGI